MLDDGFPYFPGKIESGKARITGLEKVDHSQGVPVVIESAVSRHQLGEFPFACVAERRMSDVMDESDRFHQILIEPQSTGDRPRNLSHFKGVGQTGSVVIPLMIGKDLGFIGKVGRSSLTSIQMGLWK